MLMILFLISKKKKNVLYKTAIKSLFSRKQLLFNETLLKIDLLLLGNKLIEKMLDPGNAKENYQ